MIAGEGGDNFDGMASEWCVVCSNQWVTKTRNQIPPAIVPLRLTDEKV